MPGAHGRALLTRLQQRATQPQFVYRHDRTVGDRVVGNDERPMHRSATSGRSRPGRPATAEAIGQVFEAMI